MDSIDKVLEYLTPFTKEEGVYLEKKVIINEFLSSTNRIIYVYVDIASSFPNGEGTKIKAYLRNNGFQYGSDAYTRTIPINSKSN